MRRAAHSSGCARCGAGAGCSAIRYQSLFRVVGVQWVEPGGGPPILISEVGFGVSGFRFGVWCIGVGVGDSAFGIRDSGFGIRDSEFGILYERSILLKISGNEVYYTNYLIFLVKNMLCSKLHYQNA